MSSCTCARVLHQLCNSCAVDSRWFRGTGAHPHGAIKVVAPPRRLQSRFRCETTVVAHWASASPASLSRGTRSSAHSLLPSSSQSLLCNETTGITIGSLEPIRAVANAIDAIRGAPFEPHGSIENVNDIHSGDNPTLQYSNTLLGGVLGGQVREEKLSFVKVDELVHTAERYPQYLLIKVSESVQWLASNSLRKTESTLEAQAFLDALG